MRAQLKDIDSVGVKEVKVTTEVSGEVFALIKTPENVDNIRAPIFCE